MNKAELANLYLERERINKRISDALIEERNEKYVELKQNFSKIRGKCFLIPHINEVIRIKSMVSKNQFNGNPYNIERIVFDNFDSGVTTLAYTTRTGDVQSHYIEIPEETFNTLKNNIFSAKDILNQFEKDENK